MAGLTERQVERKRRFIRDVPAVSPLCLETVVPTRPLWKSISSNYDRPVADDEQSDLAVSHGAVLDDAVRLLRSPGGDRQGVSQTLFHSGDYGRRDAYGSSTLSIGKATRNRRHGKNITSSEVNPPPGWVAATGARGASQFERFKTFDDRAEETCCGSAVERAVVEGEAEVACLAEAHARGAW